MVTDGWRRTVTDGEQRAGGEAGAVKGNFGDFYWVGRPTTTTSLTVAACHHLHHFFTLTHLTILPIAIVKDDDQHHLL